MTTDCGALTEEWRPAPGWEACYEISSLGRVRSLHRPTRPLRQPYPDHDGYPRVLLFDKGKRKRVKVHRLVAQAFHGDKRNALHNEVAHLDGNRENARADNLKWVSRVENHSHRIAHGTLLKGERHPGAKLTDDAVRAIWASRLPARRLGEQFGVSHYTIYDIRSGRRWTHVTSTGRAA